MKGIILAGGFGTHLYSLTKVKVNDFWYPNDEGGMAWNYPEIGIKWPGLKNTFKF